MLLQPSLFSRAIASRLQSVAPHMPNHLHKDTPIKCTAVDRNPTLAGYWQEMAKSGKSRALWAHYTLALQWPPTHSPSLQSLSSSQIAADRSGYTRQQQLKRKGAGSAQAKGPAEASRRLWVSGKSEQLVSNWFLLCGKGLEKYSPLEIWRHAKGCRNDCRQTEAPLVTTPPGDTCLLSSSSSPQC